MSFKRRLKFQIQNFVGHFQHWSMPSALTGPSARVAILVVAILFGTAYVYKTSALTVTGYEIYNLEKQVLALNDEIRQIQTKVAQEGSLASLKQRLPEIGYVAPARVDYLTAGPVVLVAKR